MVTASDASTHARGICKSRGVTPYGLAASLSNVRGDAKAQRVVEARGQFSGSIDDEVVRGWSLKYSTVGVVLVGSGPL